MSKGFDVAVVGATGAVGETMITILEQRQFPVRKLYPLASSRSAGSKIQFKGRYLTVGLLEEFDFSQTNIALFSAGGSVSAQYAPIAAEAGCVVIDNTSHFRMEADIPLVVPEVNAADIAHYRERNIIANPNCSTIQDWFQCHHHLNGRTIRIGNDVPFPVMSDIRGINFRHH